MSSNPWTSNVRPVSRAEAETAFAAWLATIGADIAPPASPRIPPQDCVFDRFTAEQQAEYGRKGGRARHIAAGERYGFTADEFTAWRRIIAKGFKSDEAAEIVLRSRRAINGEGG